MPLDELYHPPPSRPRGDACAFTRTLAAVAAFAMGLGACGGVPTGGRSVCTLEARAGLTVDVRDSTANAPVGRGSIIVAREGAFADTSRDTGGFDGPYGLVYERSGTYDLTVLQKGYRSWSKSDILVTKGDCHVNGVAVAARLQP